MSRGRNRRNSREIERRAVALAGELLEKAIAPGGAAMFANANRGTQPRGVSMVDAVAAMTGGQMPASNGTFGMVPMPRNPLDEVPFGPLWPLRPDPLDPARRDTGRPEPRISEYPVAWNIPGNGERLIPWRVLREAADGVDIMRRCIQIRQRHIRGLDGAWTISEKAIAEVHQGDASLGREDAERQLREKFLPEIKRMEAFWAHPWKSNGWSFGQWVNGVIEEHLVLDAVAIYPRTTYGGDVLDLEVIDGTTIKPLLDYRGARPQPPYPAYQQLLQGFPRGEWQASVDSVDAEGNALVKGAFLADQLFYGVENVRTTTPYGYSAVEQALISAKLYLARQGWMISEYDDGVGPALWLVPQGKGQGYGPQNNTIDGMNPAQRQAWQDALNDMLRGNTKGRQRAQLAPPGMTPVFPPGIPEQYKPEYDLHLIKLLAGHFGVTMSELGFTEAKGLGNSGLHEGQADVEQRVGQRPDERMVAELINELSHDYLRCPPEVCFKFTSDENENSVEREPVNKGQRERGTITVNDERRKAGMAPLNIPEADMPMVLNGGSWVPLEGLAQAAEQERELAQTMAEDQLATSEQDRELAQQSADMEAEELSGTDAEKALELSAYQRWNRKDRARGRMFMCKALEPSDWPGEQVPANVDFEAWAWVAEEDIEKAAGGHDGWRHQARDSKGRWVKLGHMRANPLGPDRPGKAILDGLARDASARRDRAGRVDNSSTTLGGMTTPSKPKRQTKAEQEKAAMHGEALRLAVLNPTDSRDEAAKRAELDRMDTESLRERSRFLRGHLRSLGIDPRTDAMRAADERTMAQHDADLTARRARAAESAAAAARAPITGAPGYTSEGDRISAADRAERIARGITDEQAAANRARFGRRDDLEAKRARFEGAKRNANAAANAADAAGGDDLAANARRDAAWAEHDRLRAEYYAAQDAERGVIDPAAKPTMVGTPEDNLRAVVGSLESEPGAWVSLVDVRAKLAERGMTDRGEQDDVIRAMAHAPGQPLVASPEENQKTLTDADRAASIFIGGEDKHVIMIEPKRDAPLTEEEAIRRADAAGQAWDDAKAAVDTFGDQAHMRGEDEGEEFERQYAALQAAERAASKRYDDAERVVSDVQRPRLAAESAAKAKALHDAVEAAQAPFRRRQALMEETKYHPATMDRSKVTPDVVADFVAKRSEGLDSVKHGLSYDQMALAGVHGDDIEAAVKAGAVKRKTNQAGQERYFAATPQEREHHAEVQRIQAETRAELLRRTPEAYGKLLGGERNLTHAPSRKLVEAMQAQGFVVTGNRGGTSTWEAPDGRKVDLILQPGGKVAAHTPRTHSMKDAHEYVGVGRTNARQAEATAAQTPGAPAAPAAAPVETPAPDPTPVPAAQTGVAEDMTPRAYRALLATAGEGGRIVHPQSRKIVETMERGGWKLADVKPGMSEWKHEDGRRITMLSGKDRPTFMADGQKLTGKAALEHVQSDHVRTQDAVKRIRTAGNLDAQMDALDAELERRDIRAHTRAELERARAAHEARMAATREPEETPEARMERVKAEVEAKRRAETAAAQREISGAVEYVGNVMPATRGEGAELATRLGLEMFNVQDRPDGSFTFALAGRGQDGSARLATFDSARGGWILPGLGGYTFDASDPEFMAAWLYEGTKASYLNDNTKRAHRVSELLRVARRDAAPKGQR